jgi:hypothetical protein
MGELVKLIAICLILAATVIPANAQHWQRGGVDILGGVIGGVIGGMIARPQPYYYPPPPPVYYQPPPVYYPQPGYYAPPDAIAYCSQRFRSYDPRIGAYMGYDGQWHRCP